MMEKFLPKLYVEKVSDIDMHILKKNGINGMAFDIDNTISLHNCNKIDEQVLDFISDAKLAGFKICLLSNNTFFRVNRMAKKLKIKGIAQAMKPFPLSYKKVSDTLGLPLNEVCMIGDQIFTDVLGANIAGMYSVLVKRLGNNEHWIIKRKRTLERMIMKMYNTK